MRRTLLLPLIVSCALFIENLDSTVLSTSLPMIAKDLAVDPIALKLALTSYLVSLAVFIPISGWVADRVGARITFATAIGVFMLGSLCCAFSGSLPAFVAARFLQGTGGAMMVPVGRLVLLRSIPKRELVQALNTLTMPALVGPVIGPPLGGFITTYFHWSWIFLINLPIGAVGVWLALRFIPPLRERDMPPLDAIGFALSGLGLAATTLGTATLWDPAMPARWSILCIGVGAASLAAYGLHERRAAYPLLDLALLRVPTFRAGVVGGALFRVGYGAVPFLLPLMLQVGFGMTPFQSGLLTFVSAVGSFFMKTLSSAILRRWGFRTVLSVNAILAPLTIAACALFAAGTPHAVILAVLGVGGCVRSLQFTSMNAISYAEIAQPRMSRATSLASVVQQLALSFGVTVGAYALQLAGHATGDHGLAVANFRFAFGAVALVAMTSISQFVRLPADAGAEMSGQGGARPAVDAPE